ncbi:XdhC/CoxI family protein [Shewanella sp. Isolate8]|uniref:XdhC family protein n=1 Tax=Shewanella sp. Isolate8 TaxID=2908529 RepID=UPI001EFEA8B3|nr:XdhC/CoxI family protein [Shewanella sp. Isolate8]MCG9746781.1 XdhC family protein [Shewanella sp. Isolate8]
MSHHIEDLLNAWSAAPQDDWVLAVVTHVEGSAYRKVGAMMLIHGMGKSVGLVSGGCLEADLRRRAQKVIQTGQAASVCYDATDEADASYQLGCGGLVHLMLVPLCAANHFLHFQALKAALASQGRCHYQLDLIDDSLSFDSTNAAGSSDSVGAQVWCSQQALDDAKAGWQLSDFPRPGILQGQSVQGETVLCESVQGESASLVVPLRERHRIAIFGGGLDAQPVCQIALQLGWRVDVVDRRTSYAREYDFVGANIIKCPVAELPQAFWTRLDGAIVMQHNLELDSEALAAIHASGEQLKYLALLGPGHRRDRVLALAGLDAASFNAYFSAPAGLALGGELPASIALSILSECHGVLHGAKRVALKEVMA